MEQHNVRSAEDALAYLLDCSLATVADLAMKKSAAKSELRRQIIIAQRNYDWCIAFNSQIKGTRGLDVLELAGGSVAKWAERYRPGAHSQ
jgi:hypothetical protein